jgi:hypothetical protein
MEDGRIPNSFKYNTVDRYVISERERDVHMQHSPPEIQSPKSYNFLWN